MEARCLRLCWCVIVSDVRAGNSGVQAREWILTAAVILVPLVIAIVVTFWSLEQTRYRRKAWRPPEERDSSAGTTSGMSPQRDIDRA
jgi:hypothetical protein